MELGTWYLPFVIHNLLSRSEQNLRTRKFQMSLSEFEKQRQANIERNKRLLNNLNISALSGDISRGISKVETKEKKQQTPTPKSRVRREQKVKKEVVPVRRSRRLAGEKINARETSEKELEEAERKIRNAKEEYDELKKVRITGSLSLDDLVKFEGEDSIKNILARADSKVSAGDFYELVVKKEFCSKDVQQLRDEYERMKIYDQWDAKQLKITPERVQYITFHPSAQHKLILAGDVMGHFGIFNADNREDIDIINYKLHARNISKIEFNYNDLNKVYTASSDGTIRLIDMEKFKSDEFYIDPTDEGITDLEVLGNDMFYATKNGEFGKIDIRSPKHSSVTLRMADKKIGGFAINPLDPNLVATASLDRTMKLWDLRYQVVCDWSKHDDGYKTATNYAIYDSKLSVSTVDWNRSNDLVCNGYDNTINIFNLNEHPELKLHEGLDHPHVLEPENSIPHNCKTGRWVSILKARWQRFGRDGHEKFTIGNMMKPLEVFDNHGNQLAHLTDPSMTNVPAACNLHPTENWVVGAGASSKIYLYY